MNRSQRTRSFALVLVFSLASAFTLNATAFIGVEQQHSTRAFASTNRHDRQQRTIDVEGQTAFAEQSARRRDINKSWLLRPEVFDSLSATGRRTALKLNGLLQNEPRVRKPSIQPGFTEQATPGDNIRVNDPSMDDFGATNSETSIAVNGQNVIITFNDASFFDVAGYSFSTDGGNTFTHKRLPTPDKGFGDSLGDGVAAFGPKGEIYYSTIADDRDFTVFIGVAKSTDNGATFSQVVDASTSASNDTDFQDKEWIAVDRGAASPFKGNVYATWTDFTQSNGSFIRCSRSTDEGASFRRSVVLSPQDGSQSVQGSMPAVAPNGDVYIAYADRHFNSGGGITIVKSTDGGSTFSAPKSAATLISVGAATGGNDVRTNSFPSITIDKNGTAHVVYNATVIPNGSDRSDVFYTRSTNGGTTFSAPVKLNDDGTPTTQLFPSIGAASDGTLGVKWWDRRNDPLNDGLTDVYMTISRDGGASFEKNFRVTNHNWVFGPSELGDYHGDYDGIAADGSNFFLSWSDERGSDPDAYFAQIPMSRDANSPDFNISARKPFASVKAGNAVDFEFSTTGAGVAGSLTLTAQPAITGLQYMFANASVNVGDVARLTVSASGAVEAGTYMINVAATGQGITRKTNVRVNVLDAARSVEAPRQIIRTPGFTDVRQGLKEDSTGTIHLAFDDDTTNVRGSDVYYSKSIDGGATYSAPIKVAPTALISGISTLVLDGAGNPFIAWTGFTGSPVIGVFLSRSTDHGATFLPPVGISSPSQSANLANLAVDKNGNVMVTYLDITTNSPRLFAARSSNGGASFSTPVQISQTGESISSIGGPVAFDSTGSAYVVYSNLTPSVPTINMTKASDGQRFATRTIISDLDVAAFAPNLAIDGSDNLYVTFYNRGFFAPFFSREVMLIKSTDRGNSFRPQIDASNNFGESTIPFVILGKSGEVNLVWQDTDENDQSDVFVARSTDGGIVFTEPVNLSANTGVSFEATGTANANGDLVLAWTDDSPANPDLFSVTLPGLAAPPPDFALVFNPTEIDVSRGSSVTINAFISRPGGFAGNVTVTAPDVSSLKIKLKGGDTKSTTGDFVSFKFKLKGGGPTGPQQITFSARDDAGRVRNGVLTLFIF